MDIQLPPDLGTRFGNIDDLPDSLREQLAATRLDAMERDVLQLIRDEFSGVATVDEIWIGLYRKNSTVLERKKVAGKLYRMATAKPPLLVSIEGKRGTYGIP